MKIFALSQLLLLVCLIALAATGKSDNDLQPQTLSLSNVEALFQIPTGQPLRGVIFLAHGCSHSATDFWPASSTCPSCLGLPIELQIIRHSLSRGFAVIAVSSQDRRSKCWREQDVGPVSTALRLLYANHIPHSTTAVTTTTAADSSKQLPLYLLGASSGGRFVSVLGQHKDLLPLRVSAICVQISPPAAHLPPHLRSPLPTPPAIFILMERDKGLAAWVNSYLQEEGKRVGDDAVVLTPPHPVAPHFFQQHANISSSISTAIYQLLQSGGFLDGQGYLREDPRRSGWRECLMADKGGVAGWLKRWGDDLVPDRSAVSELLNVAFAQHEIIAEHMDKTLDFFIKHGG